MANSTNFDGQTLVIPGAYVKSSVQNSAAGLSTTGVLMIVGEAESGPDYSEETDYDDVTFGPDQQADVIAKYKSGRIVDAFRGAVAAADDPQIQGSFNRIVIMKTNAGTKASSEFTKIGGGSYGTFYDRSYGKNGNLINYTIIQATAEEVPTTGPFTYLLPIDDYDISIRVNGGAVVNLSTSALQDPPAFVTAVDALAGVSASGGTNRNAIAVAGTLAVALNGSNSVTITRSVAWTNTPTVGDTLYIPVGSVIAGAANANVGSYVITARTTTTITATKLRNASGSPGTVTAPVTVGAAAIAAVTDLQCFAPVTISVTDTTVLPGIGKSLEINELSTGTDLISNYCYQLNTTPVTWISKSGTPAIITSDAEYGVNVTVARQSDNISDSFDVNGRVALRIGYTGTTCSVVIDDDTLTTTVVGGSGANLAITLSDFATIADLAVYINAQTGYNASVETASVGQYSPTLLDNVTLSGGTTWGNPTARIKIDGYLFFNAVEENTSLVQLNDPAEQAATGLPDVKTLTFLAGGTRGATTNADVQGAIDALASVRGNFLVPLFSVDATTDIENDETDAASTYTIDSINAYAKTHVLAMSTIKRKRHRQAFCSKQDTFTNVKNAAANLASARVSMAFQDIKDVGLEGIVQFQPWMGAIKAAGMQAAGFYRSIFNKGINCSGVLMFEADYNDTSDTQTEEALLNGLLPAKRREQGGFTWVSDQTTYTRNSNFVFNSIQAMYAADTVALTIAQRMEETFLGQSLADVSAALALSALSGICFDLLRQKLLAPSDDAPGGFKDAFVRIVGPVMYVSLSVKLATSIYFIPISIQVEEVTQSAG